MSSYSQTDHPPPSGHGDGGRDPERTPNKRKGPNAVQACKRCRHLKQKCVGNPCHRCVRKKMQCEWDKVNDPSDSSTAKRPRTLNRRRHWACFQCQLKKLKCPGNAVPCAECVKDGTACARPGEAFRLDVPVRSDYALPASDPSSQPLPWTDAEVKDISDDYPVDRPFNHSDYHPYDHPGSSSSTTAPQSHSAVMTGTPLYTHNPSAWGPSERSDQSLDGSSLLSQPIDLDQHQRASRDRFSVDVQQRDSVQHGWIQNIASATTHDSGYDAPQSAYTPYQPSFASSYPAQHLDNDMAAQPTLYGPAHPFADDFLFNDPLVPTMPFTDAEVDAWFNMPPQQYPSGGFWNQ